MVDEGFIELPQEKPNIGRDCIICGETIILRGVCDITMVCKNCCKMVRERRLSHKSNWIPNSKGGEPNHR